MKKSVIEVSLNLLRCKSITPDDGGALQYISKYMSDLGFRSELFIYGDTKNLYAKLDCGGKNFCYAGHVDVVPPGEISLWKTDPFNPMIEDGKIIGRGTSDMKCAIAAFMVAVKRFIDSGRNIKNSISLLLTSDEEGCGENGTVMILETLAKSGEKIDYCLIGEPTSANRICDTIKIGRRGSVNFDLEVFGKQGHVAYPHLADNPITKLCTALIDIKSNIGDDENEYFQSSNMEPVSLGVNNDVTNIIPNKASAMFNIRFNNLKTCNEIVSLVQSICNKHCGNDFILKNKLSGESCLSANMEMANIASDAVRRICKYVPEMNTNGGISDGKHIHKYCSSWAELGLLNSTAHQVNENITISDLLKLIEVYHDIITHICMK